MTIEKIIDSLDLNPKEKMAMVQTLSSAIEEVEKPYQLKIKKLREQVKLINQQIKDLEAEKNQQTIKFRVIVKQPRGDTEGCP